MLSIALWWHGRGVMPLPIIWGTKRAAVAWRQYQAVGPTEETVTKWFSGQRRNLGLLCGPVSSNLVVLDFDSLRRYYLWWHRHPNLATSYTVMTPRPGRHVYLFIANPPERTLNLPGLDAKVSGYVLAPPSQVGKAQYQAAYHMPIKHIEHLEEALDKAPRRRGMPNMCCGQRSPQGFVEGNSHPHHVTQPSIADHPIRHAASAHRSTKSIIAKIKINLPITELLSEYTGLYPSDPTGRYWMCCCPMPWHRDRHPSFWVDAETGRCSCFVPQCRAKFGGRPLDVIGLTRYLEGLTLAQAIAALAQRLEL